MRVNFDANASLKPLPEVFNCLANYNGEFLNASAVHQSGQKAKLVLDEARIAISELLSLRGGDKVVFTSGATESNNAALQIPKSFIASGQTTIACSAVEHSAVLEFLRYQARQGSKLIVIPAAKLNDKNSLSEIITDDLKLFALMAANNETGQIFDVQRIAAEVKKISPRARIHCDAVQAIGKINLNFPELGVDTLAISGHKLGALSGVGALVISEHCHLEPWLFGGAQEFGLRAGTENVLAIKTLGIACRQAKQRLELADSRMLAAKEAITSFLAELGDLAHINRFGDQQLPNTVSVRFPNLKADDLVVALDLCGVAISAGSACASGRPSPSHVLLAHGLSIEEAKETVRISVEPTISETELEFGLSILKETLVRMLERRRAA